MQLRQGPANADGADSSDRPAASGQRARNKIDKLQRIKESATQLFIEKGFDDTTTREIAVRASVGIGTLFNYANDKRDLLFLVYNRDLENIVETASQNLNPHKGVNDNLIAIFEPHYEFFGRQPELSRIILREMLFYGSGQQATRYRQNRVRLMNLISQPFCFGMKAGTVRQDVDADTLGWIAFAIFQVELRRWIAEPAQDLNEGIVRLRTELAIFESGFALR